MKNEPAYSFTIPSIGDDISLDCRLYKPSDLLEKSKSSALRGAIVAHPYAPLGGCQDDPVVLSVAETLLDLGHIVLTFNFRGAGESAGRTSWTGHPETEDYASVVGLLVYYLQQLQSEMSRGPDTLAPIISTNNPDFESGDPFAQPQSDNDSIHILLAGYSFGSLILARLPPVSSILTRFEAAEKGTSASEIFLRARTLAKQTQASLEAARRPSTSRGRKLSAGQTPSSPNSRASPVTVGGEETDPSQRRRSRDSKRSTDIVRDVPNRIKTHIRRHSGSSSKHDTAQRQRSGTVTSTVSHKIPSIVASYLLISPVLLPLTTMLLPPGLPSTLALPFGLSSHPESGVFSWTSQTLLVFGSDDTFTSGKRLRQWAEKLQRQSSGKLQWKEVEDAGHFWREQGAMQELTSKIRSWDGIGSSDD